MRLIQPKTYSSIAPRTGPGRLDEVIRGGLEEHHRRARDGKRRNISSLPAWPGGAPG